MAPPGNNKKERIVWVKGMKMGNGALHDEKTDERIEESERESGDGTVKSPKV